MKRNYGITLIALVVTIVVLLILAGITISLTVGQGGIIEKAQQARIKNAEAIAREKLELALFDLQADKVTKVEYNENEYIDSYLCKKQMAVMGDVVLVDGWQFQIDRSVPKIIASLGQGEESKIITLVAKVENASDYTKATLKIEIAYEGEIANIQINGEDVEIPEKQNGKYVLEKEVLQNGNYTVFVKDINEDYKITIIDVTEISEDVDIYTVEDLMTFRDRVNKGATYIGKTINLMNDLDLQCSINNQWIPIGNRKVIGDGSNDAFYGIFEGNNHSIKGIYINDPTKSVQGFFGRNRGTIRNLTVENGTIIAEYRIGGIVGGNYGTIENTVNKMNLEATAETESGNSLIGGIVGSMTDGTIKNSTNYGDIVAVGASVGGICGWAENSASDITNCANLSNLVKTTGANATGYSYVGGIVGYSKNSNITQAYNIANIIGAKSSVGGIVGLSTGTITKCYNTGVIQSLGVNNKGNNTTGGIAGYAGNTVSNCYNTGNITGTAKIVGGIIGSNATTNLTIKQEIKNCYNIGSIGKGVYYGGIIGIGGSSTNCYYLTGKAGYGIGGSTSTNGNNTGATAKTEAELKSLTGTLGTEYTADTQNEDGTWKYNNGYPILKWQVTK